MVAIKEYIRESNKIEGVEAEKAVNTVYEAWGEIVNKPLTHETVKSTHQTILKDRQPEIAGEYRNKPVTIGDDLRDNQDKIHDQMTVLLNKEPTNATEALLWHIEFEKIHPFADGNGRTGRLLYLYHCNKLNVEPIFWQAKHREGYYSLFNISKNTIGNLTDNINSPD